MQQVNAFVFSVKQKERSNMMEISNSLTGHRKVRRPKTCAWCSWWWWRNLLCDEWHFVL